METQKQSNGSKPFTHIHTLFHKHKVTGLGVTLVSSLLYIALALASVGVAPATGGSSISADTNGATGTGVYTTLTGPVLTEGAVGDIGGSSEGTIILNAPSGFEFDTGGTAPTVLITRVTGNGDDERNINEVASGTHAAITSRTSSKVTFTIRSKGKNGVKNSLTWENLRVSTSGLPLATGNITFSGTASVNGITGSTNLGTLSTGVGTAAKLAFTTQPSSTATTNTEFGTKPVVAIQDVSGNTITTATNSITLTARTGATTCANGSAGTGTITSTPTAAGSAATAGVLTYTAMKYSTAETIKLCASATGLTSALSNAVAVSNAAPVVTNVTSTLANGSYKAGQVVPVTVTFDQSVTVTGTPQLALSTGIPATTAVNYSSGSPGTTLTFNYTVAAGNTSADLDYASVSALALNGGTIKDTATNLQNATLTLVAPAAVGSLGANKAIVIDTTAPTLSSVTIASNNADTTKAKPGDTITLSFTSSESITSPTVTIGGVSASVSGGPTVWTASRVLTVSDTEGSILFNISFSDIAGNTGTAVTTTTNASSVTFDKTVSTLSTVTIVSNNANPSKAKEGDVVTLTFTSTESIATPTVLIGGSAATISGGPTVWTASRPMTAGDNDGNVSFNVAFSDLFGNAGSDVTATTDASSVTFDKTVPTVDITSASSSNTNVSPISVTVTFSEDVTGFDSSDVVIGNGSISNFSGGPSVYTFDVSPTAQGNVTVNVAGGVANDAAGNDNTVAIQLSRNFDNVAPTVVLSSFAAEPTNSSPITVAAAFSENVAGFTLSDITVTNGTAGNLTGGPASYSFDVTPNGNGTVTVEIGAGVVKDGSDNDNTASGQLTRVFDSDRPTVALTSGVTNPTNASPISMTASFSEDVTGFDSADIIVTNGIVSNFGGGPSVYVFDVIPTVQGAITVNVTAGVAQDSSTNDNFAAVQYSNTYDSTPPSITAAKVQDVNTDGKIDRIVLTLNEALVDTASGSNGIDVTSVSDHGICNGETADPDGTTTLVVDFACDTVQTGIGDLNLNLSPNPGIADAAGNQVASVNLSALSSPALVDEVQPMVVSVTPLDSAVGVLVDTDVVVNFSEPMNTSSFSISDDDTNEYSAAVWSNGNATATIHHTKWSFTTLVHAVTDASDTVGLSVNAGSNYPWSFTTASDTDFGRITLPSNNNVPDAGLDVSSGVSTAGAGNIFIDNISTPLNALTTGDLSTEDLTVPQLVGDQPVLPQKAIMLKSTGNQNLSNVSVPSTEVSIPNNTTVLGCLGWDGKIVLKPGSNSGSAPTGFSVGSNVVELGSADCPLLLSQPVTILLSGQTGKVAYKPSGSTNWFEIPECTGTFAAPNPPPAPVSFQECAISDGTDTKILTYHFTSFGPLVSGPAPTPTPSSAPTNSTVSSTASGGGSPSMFNNSVPTPAKKYVSDTKVHSNDVAHKAAPTCSFSSSSSVPFTDLANDSNKIYIEDLYRKCAISGKTNSLFAAKDPVTRAELSKALVLYNGLGLEDFVPVFDDVRESDWYAPYILKAIKLGMLNMQSVNNAQGGHTLLRPNDYLTRSEAIYMILKANNVDLSKYKVEPKFADVNQADWFYKYASYAQHEKILNGFERNFEKRGKVGTLYKFSRSLGKGNQGEDVRDLKLVMMQMDYFAGDINDKYDDGLVAAVKKYQKAYNLVQSGDMGPVMKQKLLNEYLSPKHVFYFRPYDLVSRGDVAQLVYLVKHGQGGKVLGAATTRTEQNILQVVVAILHYLGY